MAFTKHRWDVLCRPNGGLAADLSLRAAIDKGGVFSTLKATQVELS